MKLAPLNTVQNAHDDSIWTAAWVPATEDSGPLLLTGSLDETMRLWNPEGPEKVQTNTGHCLGVVSVAAHPSGRIAASASIDSFIRVFDVSTNNTIATLEAPPYEVWQLQFNWRRDREGILCKGKLENYLELLRRVKEVFDKGDDEERVLALLLLGYWVLLGLLVLGPILGQIDAEWELGP